ncbi:segregation and condensation protein A [Methylotetracoccus oryzae]|uniref:segregation and condensation protein A n=1 Tax=Methylotetracoccus oryzae TaxID=1919059 RepID=UPI00111B9102|nr:ScpA family protein [Methylotetracoccus oryzae]
MSPDSEAIEAGADTAAAEGEGGAPAYAIVNGSPLTQLPEDLYIPPEALEVVLETFEGPLDLLLYLIRRQNLDILNIPIVEITRQYIDYIDMMQELKMELAAEYLLMAAILAEIKSRLLLPKPQSADEEEADPRADLIRRLQEYERFKKAAEQIDTLPRWERDIFPVEVDNSTIQIRKVYPEVDLKEVLLAFQSVLQRADRTVHHQIRREALSVRERMSSILARLLDSSGLDFLQLFETHEGRQGAVVSLLAILELAKENLIEIIQDEPLAAIWVRSRGDSGLVAA